jgi:hypothetical protein
MTKTSTSKRSAKRPDRLAMVGRTGGVTLSEAQLGQAAGGVKANVKL